MKQIIQTILIAALVTGGMFALTDQKNTTADTTPPKVKAGYEHVVETGTLRCAYATWPPYTMKDPNTGELTGIVIDQMEQIAKFLEIEIKWTEEVGFGNYIEGMNTGRYDMMCSTVWPDGARAKNTTLTMPGLYSAIYAYARTDETRDFNTLTAINTADITIAAIDGDITYSLAANRFPQAKIHALPQTSDGGAMLMAAATGKADIVFLDDGVFADFDTHNPGKLRKLTHLGPVGVFSESYSVRQGDYQLKNMIDTALIYLTNSGITADILSRYEGSFYAPAGLFVTD